MERTAEEGWTEPRKLPDAVNGVSGMHWQLSVDAANNLYFGANGAVYAARFVDGAYTKAEKVGPPVNNNRAGAFSPFIAPDGSYLIFSRAVPVYTYQFFVSFRQADGTWGEAINLSERLGQPCSLNGRVTADGRFLLFAGRHGVTYWVDAAIVEALRPKAKDRSDSRP